MLLVPEKNAKMNELSDVRAQILVTKNRELNVYKVKLVSSKRTIQMATTFKQCTYICPVFPVMVAKMCFHENSHSRKIRAPKECLTFHGITFHFSSKL